MSSAILYLAIVAIWACVLIPRWLRRDSARGGSAPVAEPAVPADTVEPEAEAEDGGPADVEADEAPRWVPAFARAAEPLSAEESRRRMLAARRRLLLMLIGLEAAAIALAVVGLAAVWVVVPPTIMLVGYLLLLREAAQADAERAQYEAEAAARAAERARMLDAQARRVTPAEGTPTKGIAEAAAVLAAKFAAAPVAADYEDSGPGRDFAPGLAGKYTTSNAGAEGADEDYYDDTYEAPRLRAVGD
jgi:hypothetical protein